RPKRDRTVFNKFQLQQLERAFKNGPYLEKVGREELAGKLGLTETQVKVWFQNRRTKNKR
ncbi:hypothetical protein HELRODRAFT_137390, partial [Helobdella robusta]|uniref:Homeobox domain-containing protein n=1 Tax=Helobdella robusta TaxID=6412 RepID=T1EIK2_HELRO